MSQLDAQAQKELKTIKKRYATRLSIIRFVQSLLFKPAPSPQAKAKPGAGKLKIAVHRVGAFGDSVVALPAIAILRQHYPDAHIDLYSTHAVGVSIRQLMAEEDVVDNIFVFSKDERQKALVQIKQNAYDLYVEIPQNLNLYKTLRNMLFVRLSAKIPSAFGWDAGRIKKHLALQKAHMNIPREVDRFVANLAEQGIKGKIAYPLAHTDVERMKVAELLKPIPLNGERKRFGLLVGGKLQAKKWPLDNWAELAKCLGQEGDVYIIGGPDEREEADQIVSLAPHAVNLCGETSILETAALLEALDLVVSQDTGAMHLAYAVGTPLVALFSTRDLSNKWHPPAASSVVLERVLSCSFCFKHDCEDNICMTGISVDDVLSARQELNVKLAQQAQVKNIQRQQERPNG
ncbi:MAG: glycosyltransferase family 9 protein [Pontibacterium sp.]